MTQYLVTGAGGFIASNFVRMLNKIGIQDIILVDNFCKRDQVQNILDLEFSAIYNPDAFLQLIESNSNELNLENAKCIHLGAISSTTYWDLDKLNEMNITYTQRLIRACISLNIDLIYASSASVYGNNTIQSALPSTGLCPSNAYALSKSIVDNYFYKNVVDQLNDNTSRVWGLRFFNVYGPGEYHKLGQCSPIMTFCKQAIEDNCINLFSKTDNSEQPGLFKRDFVHVNDCCNVMNWLLDVRPFSSILNVGSGIATSPLFL